MPDSTCPLCASRLAAHVPRPESDREDFDCPNCGRYSLARSLLGTFTWEARRAATLSHAIRRMQRPAEPPFITSSLAHAIEAEGRLANASEQLDNLVLHLGSVLVEPGDARSLRAPDMRAILGSVTENAAAWTLKQAHGSGLIQGIETKGGSYQLLDATLSVAGWERNRELLAGGSRSRTAFMASRWGDAEFDRVFRDCFKPAVERAGFGLIRMDEEPKAGLIDDHMRLEIRRSRFLIADLSHMNPGAYWEAGYAEGLGRPVIYTCRSDIFSNPASRPHFDTNHHLTIVWAPDDLTTAAKQLATTVRVTLPSEAKLTDEASGFAPGMSS